MKTPSSPLDPQNRSEDVIAKFYDHHPYPPPRDLSGVTARTSTQQRAALNLIWPERPVTAARSVLIAGCGTSQAIRHALLDPSAQIVGIDVSSTAIAESRALAHRHGVQNLQLHRLPIEDVARLGRVFDHVVCTGVLHHLPDPDMGLRSLRDVLAPGGALTLMVYAPYGRTGIYLLQDYCRRLGVEASSDEIAELVATLREIPLGHPISRLLRESRDFADDDALADALLNPRDRAYSVPQLFDLLDGAGLRFGRWARQAPYFPDCGSISETPHARLIAGLPAAEQFAAAELFRGTISRHTAIAFSDSDPTSGVIDFSRPEADRWVPVPVPTTIIVKDRLPAGAAAALLNRAHTESDLVMFITDSELAEYRRIDGHRTIKDLSDGANAFVERLFRHDLVVIDSSEEA